MTLFCNLFMERPSYIQPDIYVSRWFVVYRASNWIFQPWHQQFAMQSKDLTGMLLGRQSLSVGQYLHRLQLDQSCVKALIWTLNSLWSGIVDTKTVSGNALLPFPSPIRPTVYSSLRSHSQQFLQRLYWVRRLNQGCVDNTVLLDHHHHQRHKTMIRSFHWLGH